MYRTIAALLTLAVAVTLGGSPAAAASADLPGRHRTSTIVDRADQADSGSQFITGSDGWGLSTHPKRPYCTGCHGREALRERVRGKGWAKPRNITGNVFAPDVQVERYGMAYLTYVQGGRIWVATKGVTYNSDKRLGVPVAVATWPWLPSEGQGHRPRLAASIGPAFRRVGVSWPAPGGGTSFTERLKDGTWTEPALLPYHDEPNGYTDASLVDYIGDNLIVLWTNASGTWTATRSVRTGAWGQPQQFSAEPIRPVALNGTTLVYQSGGTDDGNESYGLHAARVRWTDEGPNDWTDRQTLATSTYPFNAQVVSDRYGRVLTVAWTSNPEPGIIVWSPDRPGAYLDAPTPILGGHPVNAWDLVTTPGGTLGVAYWPTNQASGKRAVLFRYLPAGKATWTDPATIRLDNASVWPKFILGEQPTDYDQDGKGGAITMRVTSRTGSIAHRFAHPAPVTKITGPSRVQANGQFTLRWNTTWADGDPTRVRVRTEKRHGGWTEWRTILAPSLPGWGEYGNEMPIDQPAGTTACYQAREDVGPVSWVALRNRYTPWSKERCITVRT